MPSTTNNAFLDAMVYANVMLALLKNQLVMGRLINGRFRNEVTDENGLTIHVKRPPQFIAKDGPILQEQAIVAGSTALQVDRYRNVHIAISDLEHVQSWNALMKNETMKSAASTLAHDVDLYAHDQLLSFGSFVGTPGQTVKTPQQFNLAHVRLMDQSVPNVDLSSVVTFADGADIRGYLVGTNIQQRNLSALERIKIPVISEIDLYATQHIKTVVSGSRLATGQAQVNGGDQNVDYIDVKDADYSILTLESAGNGTTYRKGEIFTIGSLGTTGVQAVNNRSGEVLPYLRQFVVMEDAVSESSGALELKIWPHIIVKGTGATPDIQDTNTAFQTVDRIPANDAVLTFYNAPGAVEPVRAAWHKQAIEMVSARLATPMSDTSSFATDPETGISIRYWRGSDINTGRHIHRWDMIYGIKTVDPRLGVRFAGAALV